MVPMFSAIKNLFYYTIVFEYYPLVWKTKTIIDQGNSNFGLRYEITVEVQKSKIKRLIMLRSQYVTIIIQIIVLEYNIIVYENMKYTFLLQ